MKLRPPHILFGVAVAVVVAFAALTLGGEQPGSIVRKDGLVTMIIGEASPDASVTYDITLQEGGDADHESSHIFDLLQFGGIRSATLDTSAVTLTVEYDSSRIAEQAIRQPLAQAGYVARSVEEATPAELAADGTAQTLYLQTGDTLQPSYFRAVAGVPLVLTFSAGTGHLSTVSVPSLGISQDLATGGATITIDNPVPGSYDFICAEGYVDGTLVIEQQ